jgi:hypothetical protein
VLGLRGASPDGVRHLRRPRAVPLQRHGTIIVSCKGCGERHAYRREEFRRFVVRPGAPSVVAMPLGDAAANELR